MARYHLPEDDDGHFDEIVFGRGGQLIRDKGDALSAIDIVDGDGDFVRISRSDIPRLERAIRKAREFGWFK